ncbi:MAG: hypothetical protein HQM10_00695 [Candidatus Riflebacteria bacterium]|nr:hypothetical protein [Candidatus Riflebacteria bacterium]
MPLIQVKNCPEDIYIKISAVAKKNNRTIAQQIIVLLENSLSLDQTNLTRRKQLLEKISSRKISEGLVKDVIPD